MEHRPAYGLLLLSLTIFLWMHAVVNARMARGQDEPPSKPAVSAVAAEPAETAQASGDNGMARLRNIPEIPSAGKDTGFKLVGTATGDDPSKSFAIIEYRSTGNQGAYREGDRLGEVLIKKILPGHVVIDAGRGDEMLAMGSGRKEGIPSAPQPAARLDRKEVDSKLPDYMRLMREIRVRPHLEEGRPSGFMIYNIEPGSIFARMGLENGDVIAAVNGMSVETTQEAIAFYEALKKGGTLVLQIKRGESLQELRFEIR